MTMKTQLLTRDSDAIRSSLDRLILQSRSRNHRSAKIDALLDVLYSKLAEACLKELKEARM